MKAATSDHMLNIIQSNNPLYKILEPLQEQTATGTVDALIRVKGLQRVIRNFNEVGTKILLRRVGYTPD